MTGFLQINKHTDWVTALGFSPDGRLLATADRNGGALLWQATAGHERADLRGHKKTITSLDWRADAAMLATASEDGTVRLWNPAGKEIKSVTAHKSGVLSVRFAGNGNWVTTGRDRQIKTWKPDGGNIAELAKLPDISLAAVFSHDGKKIIASDYSGELRVFDVESKKQLAALQPNPQHLAQRLSDADKVVQQLTKELTDGKQGLEQAIASLKEGTAIVGEHEAKLTKAQAELAERRKKLDELTKLFAMREQNAATSNEQFNSEITNLQAAEANLAEAEAKTDGEVAPDQLATLKQKFAASQKTHTATQQAVEKANEELLLVSKQRQDTEQLIRDSQSLVSTIANATAGLPDLAKLNEQREQAESKLADSQQKLLVAEQAKVKIVTLQTRLAQATSQIAQEIELQQGKQQELAKQSGRFEAEHQQAASSLAAHREKLNEATTQLKAIQAKLSELQAAESKLTELAQQRTSALSKVQAELEISQQSVELLQQRKQDFESAEELRKDLSLGE